MKIAPSGRALDHSRVRWRCSPQTLGYKNTSEIQSKAEIIGQPRALAALQLGIEIQSPGYNVFVVGLTGTGKATTIRHVLDSIDLPGTTPDDLCYVHNFDAPDTPLAISLPAGIGREVRRDVLQLIDEMTLGLTELQESEEYQTHRRKLVEDLREKSREIFKSFEALVAESGFQMIDVPMGAGVRTELHALVAGEPMSLDKLHELSAEGRFDKKELEKLRKVHAQLSEQMQQAVQRGRAADRELRDAIRALHLEFAKRVVAEPIEELCQRYAKYEKVVKHLESCRSNLLDGLSLLHPMHESQQEDGSPRPEFDFSLFEINLVVDHAGNDGAPVVIENSPSFKNLFGSIDFVPDRQGMWRSDFSRVRAGSLLHANGGYLVLNLLDAAQEPGVWPTLKRFLKNRQAEIRTFEMFAGPATPSLKPEAVALNLKVILIGDSYTYNVLHAYDEEFRKIFKVKADFDSSMKRTKRSMKRYGNFLAQLVETESLCHFDSSGVAAMIEIGARLAGRQTRLSTRFSEIADIAREASYWAQKSKSRWVTEKHIEQALVERRQRLNLLEDKIQEQIENGGLLLDIKGKKTGQINALTIYDLGDYMFGRPTRITSEVSMGRSGIINIEREANLSGSSHDKGVLILAGYLRAKYAQERPLTLSASICFEQSYGGVDGDSASAAELIVLMSAIAKLPLRQDLAITGSINQKGELQPIGGVNEKIEGYFDVCRARGLSGTQGVVIPPQNVEELMLRKDVAQAIRSGEFHIYVARSIDQALEIMTGYKAGRSYKSGYERDSVHRAVDEALAELAEQIKEYVDGSDTPAGRVPSQGLSDDDEEDGEELRPRRRKRR